MKAYEDRKPSYFGTPPVNLIVALETSLKIIVKEGMEARVNRHHNLAEAFRSALESIRLKFLPESEEICANTLTAVYYPKGINAADLLSKLSKEGVIVAGGLLPELKASYFRIGHMGSVSSNDLFAVLSALERALIELGYSINPGDGLRVFQNELLKPVAV